MPAGAPGVVTSFLAKKVKEKIFKVIIFPNNVLKRIYQEF